MPKNTRLFRSSLCLAFFCLMLHACKQEEKPPVPVAQMKDILLDIHLAEAYSSIVAKDSLQKARYNKNTDSLSLFYKQILSRNNISADAFEVALKWYSLHPDKLDSVYTGITPVLDSMKAKIPAKQ